MNDNSEIIVSLHKINGELIAKIPISDKVTINNFYNIARKRFYPKQLLLLPIDKIIYNGDVLNELDDKTNLFSKISNDNDTLNSSVEMNVILDERNLVDIHDMQGQIIEKVYITEHMIVKDLYKIIENNVIASEYNFSWTIMYRDIYCRSSSTRSMIAPWKRKVKVRELLYNADINPLIVVSSTRLTKDKMFKFEKSDMIFYDINDSRLRNGFEYESFINELIIKDIPCKSYPIYVFNEIEDVITNFTTVDYVKYHYIYDNKGEFIEKIQYYS